MALFEKIPEENISIGFEDKSDLEKWAEKRKMTLDDNAAVRQISQTPWRELREPSSGSKNPKEQYELGKKYYEGRGVKKNYAKAFRYFIEASDGGISEADTMFERYALEGVNENSFMFKTKQS
jgi:TPR repeat protein